MTCKIEFTSEKRETFDGWSRGVRVGNQEFQVYVRRGNAVLIPYKPRGQNRGYIWHGSVYRAGGGRVWTDRVPGSIGCRGLLMEAGVLCPTPPDMGREQAAGGQNGL